MITIDGITEVAESVDEDSSTALFALLGAGLCPGCRTGRKP